jgi:hypothetical protein
MKWLLRFFLRVPSAKNFIVFIVAKLAAMASEVKIE